MAGALPAEAAQHVHRMAADEKAAGAYQPKAFTDHEYQTLQKLADLIIPADDKSPGATAAGAPAFIDLLASQNPKLAAIYTGGISWLDHFSLTTNSATFLASTPEQQTAILDRIAYRRNASPELGPGIVFFEWARRMVVDAFYTSPIGVKDLGFQGNGAMVAFSVPQAAIDYAVKRSPV
jgi:molybdopterin-guanine dinucleotide biosynthesis protein A